MLDAIPELHYLRILHGMSLDELEQFLAFCTESEVEEGAVLMVEGEQDAAMVIVVEGALEVVTGAGDRELVVRRVGKGEQVGALSAMGLVRRRTATVRATQPSRLVVCEKAGLDALRKTDNPIFDNLEESVLAELAGMLREADRQAAKLAIGHDVEPEAAQGAFARLGRNLSGRGKPGGSPPRVHDIINSSALFPEVDAAVADRLEQVLIPRGFAEGEHLVDEGGKADVAWIIASGKVGVFREVGGERHEKLGELGPGAVLGHVALIDGEARTADCVVEEPCWAWAVPKALVSELVHRRAPEARAIRMGFIRALLAQLGQAYDALARIAAEREHLAESGEKGFFFEHDLTPARLALVGPL
ncbi:MAG: cyclic nucleotide-binding domain-containing protein [Alphaproteobacteria bacterium]|nr:cyclic nucleotide-binding domain-containing protein [Alphaproteobacteria bacterium]